MFVIFINEKHDIDKRNTDLFETDLPSFCKLAKNSVIDGIDHEKIGKAAKSLEQSEEIVSNAVRALAQILTLLAFLS